MTYADHNNEEILIFYTSNTIPITLFKVWYFQTFLPNYLIHYAIQRYNCKKVIFCPDTITKEDVLKIKRFGYALKWILRIKVIVF